MIEIEKQGSDFVAKQGDRVLLQHTCVDMNICQRSRDKVTFGVSVIDKKSPVKSTFWRYITVAL